MNELIIEKHIRHANFTSDLSKRVSANSMKRATTINIAAKKYTNRNCNNEEIL